MTTYGPDKARQEAIRKAKEQMLKNAGRMASGQQQARRFDQWRRDQAEARDASHPVFLRPQDLSGDYDFKRALNTTLGGIPRAITRDDLIAFAKNVEVMQEKYQKGISPRDVIDFSLSDDRERATKEIFLCSPFSRKNGVVRFVTNAGPESKDNRHYVSVQFNEWSRFVTAPKKPGGGLTRDRLVNSSVKFDCDCGRHTFWFRYIATTAGFALGRQEGGYPKIRNPKLQGVACKHVLRVMQFILSPMGVQYLRKQAEKDRGGALSTAQKQTEKQMADLLEHQTKTSHHKRNQVLATHERPGYAKRLATQAAQRARRQAAAEQKSMTEIAAAQARRARARTAYDMGLITADDYKILTGEAP